MSSIIVNCKNCNCEFMARIADINRGWGQFHNKSCKASYQAKHGTKNKNTNVKKDKDSNNETLRRINEELFYEQLYEDSMDGAEEGWDGHKD